MHFKKKKENLFIIGMFSLLIALILGRFDNQYPIIDFLEGMFTGISLTMNISFLVRFRIERGMKDKITDI